MFAETGCESTFPTTRKARKTAFELAWDIGRIPLQGSIGAEQGLIFESGSVTPGALVLAASPFPITRMMPRAIRRNCAAFNNHRSDNSSTSVMRPPDRPSASGAADLAGSEPRKPQDGSPLDKVGLSHEAEAYAAAQGNSVPQPLRPLPNWPDVPRDRLSVDFYPAAEPLKPYVTGYNLYGVFGPEAGKRELYFPGWTTIRFSFPQTPWRVRYGRGEPETVMPMAVFGPSATDLETDSVLAGISVGFVVLPLGMARLLPVAAGHLAGRLTALETLWGDAEELMDRIAALPDAAAIPSLLDEILLARLGPPHRDEALVAALARLLVDQHDIDTDLICEALGCSPATLRRLSQRHFGFAPKLLLRRSRFLKSLFAIMGQEQGRWGQLIDPSYADQSHFIRECHEFLNCTPSEFLRRERPMTVLSMKRRAEVLGSPLVALHHPRR
ncbi:MAG: AraC family transcriptional regulator [Porphyrobacter sp.]|nr:AraC family transcriptional regulator [Porphyrobacter sp.]